MTIGTEHVNDYPLIRFEIRFERKFPIRRSLIYRYHPYLTRISAVKQVHLARPFSYANPVIIYPRTEEVMASSRFCVLICVHAVLAG